MILTLVVIAPWQNTPLVKAAWYSTGGTWNYRQKIIIDHNKVPNTDQTDFPVLVKITDTNNPIFTKAQSDGDDLLFTSSNETTKLSHEIEKFTTTVGSRELIAWVKIPTLSHLTDTVLYMYYGDPSCASQQAAASVWSNGYAGVWHMGDATTSTISDSTGNSSDGTKKAANEPIVETGKMGSGQRFDGANDYMSLPVSKPSMPLMFSFWANPNTDTDIQGLYDTAPGAGDVLRNYGTYAQWHGSPAQYIGGNTANTWTYITICYRYVTDTRYVDFYRNGSFVATASAVGSSYFEWNQVRIGDINAALTRFAGVLDEYNIHTSNRSADWIATEYANQNSPETFMHINGEVGKDNYTIPTEPAGWYAPDWAKRQPITINHALVPNTDQTDFPTLIKLTDAGNDLFDSAQADGDDILFADTAGNKLAHEIEKYDPATHELWAWVKIPSLSHTVNTTIYMHYANPNAPNQQSKTAVWSNGYVGVWHMGEASGSNLSDSTGHGYTAIKSGSPTQADGRISKAQYFGSGNS
ncbi:MAG: DUF2341 domain-containing protein, partial [Candidatus Berkelbacteria bacterium]|nr:DUF2341 domain-containing protein [Candidatus Berkelbacteria bacterium]